MIQSNVMFEHLEVHGIRLERIYVHAGWNHASEQQRIPTDIRADIENDIAGLESEVTGQKATDVRFVGVILVNVPAQYVLCFYLEAQVEVG